MESNMARRKPGSARIRVPALVLGALLAVGRLQGQSPAPPVDPAKLPAHDDHQGLLVAADPYLTAARSEEQFGKKNPYGAGLLAVDVYIRNNSESPITVNLSTVALEVRPPDERRQKIEALSVEEAAERIVFPSPVNPTITRVPRPPSHAAVRKNKDVTKLAAALAPRALGDIVGPHEMIHGFLFFDVAHQFDWIATSSLYLPDVSRINPEEKLLFFDVELGPATK